MTDPKNVIATNVRQPSLFLPHGGGPCFWIEDRRRSAKQAWDSLRALSRRDRREPAGAAEGVRRLHRALGGRRADGQRQPRAGHALRLLQFPAAHLSAQISRAGRARTGSAGRGADRRGWPGAEARRRARLRPRRVRAVPDRRPGSAHSRRHAVAAQRSRPRVSYRGSARRWRRCATRAWRSSAAA